ncbi:hypothetical protein SADUNF_Sadunf18G0103900 [Salix dunnii]|uniref:Galactokinase N-terminal domain-containing protein n=1 Tax=Salix dunnii TaxID=1413687 RepID=A0A835MGN1_9ROSI|nr:hypothetical protein SADUNF_Sadunf18G0103900 [Salix dunnii]
MSGSSWPGKNELNEIKNTGPTMAGRRPEEVRVVLSPHRICPLGAHIDHQCGTVSAMTINEGMLPGFNPSVDTDEDGSKLKKSSCQAKHLSYLPRDSTGLFYRNNLLRRLTREGWFIKLRMAFIPICTGWQPLKHLHHVYEILLKARGLSGARLISAGSRGYPAFADANLVEEAVTFVTEEYRCLSNLLTKACFDM